MYGIPLIYVLLTLKAPWWLIGIAGFQLFANIIRFLTGFIKGFKSGMREGKKDE